MRFQPIEKRGFLWGPPGRSTCYIQKSLQLFVAQLEWIVVIARWRNRGSSFQIARQRLEHPFGAGVVPYLPGTPIKIREFAVPHRVVSVSKCRRFDPCRLLMWCGRVKMLAELILVG